MKLVPLSQFHQVYSNSNAMSRTRPDCVWSLSLDAEGVPLEFVESCAAVSVGWTGWGFLVIESDLDYTTACLLFEHKEDAVIAKLVYGNNVHAD